MRKIRVIQFGDVHLPEGGELVDRKDAAFPEHLAHLVVPDAIQQCLHKVLTLVDEDDFLRGIFFTGDFTSRGDIAEYDRCVKLILSALRDSVPRIFNPQLLHAVPGNHDVDRSLCTSDAAALKRKFDPLTLVWNSLEMPILATDGIRETDIDGASGGSLKVFSINSCYGCGEKRRLPEQIRDDLHTILQNYSSQSSKEAFDLVGEQLDTPAFLIEDINALTDRLAQLPEKILPVILSHHNLLPQAMVRIDVYTELINSGVFRSRLLNSPGPIVYCHGHIHDDPVEIVNNPLSNDRGPLVLVAAPKLRTGFNVLEFVFADIGLPIGCTIIPYRVQRDGEVREEVHKREAVRLQSVSCYLRMADSWLVDLLRGLKTDSPTRFSQISKKLKSNNPSISEEILADRLRQAEWFGLIRLINTEDEETRNWQIKRQIP